MPPRPNEFAAAPDGSGNQKGTSGAEEAPRRAAKITVLALMTGRDWLAGAGLFGAGLGPSSQPPTG